MVWRVWGAGPPLVLLHGASGSWTHWIRNVLPLAEHFRACWLPTCRATESRTPRPSRTPPTRSPTWWSPASSSCCRPRPASTWPASRWAPSSAAWWRPASGRGCVPRLVLLGPGGLGLVPAPVRTLLRLEPGMDGEAVRHVHRQNLLTLMLARPESADELAVTVQIDNVARSRFRSGTIPVSDVLLRALPAVRWHLAGIWGGRDAFTGHHLGESREVLAAVDPTLDAAVIEAAGHWVNYEAADRVNTLLEEWLARPAR